MVLEPGVSLETTSLLSSRGIVCMPTLSVQLLQKFNWAAAKDGLKSAIAMDGLGTSAIAAWENLESAAAKESLETAATADPSATVNAAAQPSTSANGGDASRAAAQDPAKQAASQATYEPAAFPKLTAQSRSGSKASGSVGFHPLLHIGNVSSTSKSFKQVVVNPKMGS